MYNEDEECSKIVESCIRINNNLTPAIYCPNCGEKISYYSGDGHY